MGSPTALTSKAKAEPGSHSVTQTSVVQLLLPLALVPLNRAPTAGPVRP